MHLKSEITIARPRHEIFNYLAKSEYLPEYASDFVWVRQTLRRRSRPEHRVRVRDEARDTRNVPTHRVLAAFQARMGRFASQGRSRHDGTVRELGAKRRRRWHQGQACDVADTRRPPQTDVSDDLPEDLKRPAAVSQAPEATTRAYVSFMRRREVETPSTESHP
jgi:hypothetical protein